MSVLLIFAVAALAVLVALAITEDNSVADVNSAADRTLPPEAFGIWVRGNWRFLRMAKNSVVDGVVNYMRRVLIPTRKVTA